MQVAGFTQGKNLINSGKYVKEWYEKKYPEITVKERTKIYKKSK